MSYLIVLPSIWAPFTKECLSTLKAPPERILVVDNTVTNRGVAASWNMGVDRVVHDRIDWLVILSAGIRFGPTGGLDFLDRLDIVDTVTLMAEGGDGTQRGAMGWRLMAIRRETLELVGRFDEHIGQPAYLEDVDYARRLHLASGLDEIGSKMPVDAWGAEVVDDVDGHVIGTAAHGICLAHVHISFVENEIRYGRKWGCPPWADREGKDMRDYGYRTPRGETYEHPYGRYELDWTYTGPPP